MKESDENTKENIKVRERFTVVFILLMQVLSVIYGENKTRASLLYKLFKMQFVETEKKWLHALKNERQKMDFYRELCKMMVFDKNRDIEDIEEINKIIFSNQNTFENLQKHKRLINYLMKSSTQKKNEIYSLRTEVSILKSELNFWLLDYDKIKNSIETREFYEKVDIPKIKATIEREFSHKKISDCQRALIINSDIFLALSRQRSYIQEQKNFYQQELERLNGQHQRAKLKKKTYKQKLEEEEEAVRTLTSKLNRKIAETRESLRAEPVSIQIQTEITGEHIQKLQLAKSNLDYLRHYETSKFREAVEKVNAGLSRAQPMPLTDLLFLTANLYQDKVSEDKKLMMINRRRLPLDEYLYDYIKEQLGNTKVVRKRCEEVVVSVRKYMSNLVNRSRQQNKAFKQIFVP